MTADGLKMKTILLAKNLRPSKFKDSKLEAQPANELIKRNTDSPAEDMPGFCFGFNGEHLFAR